MSFPSELILSVALFRRVLIESLICYALLKLVAGHDATLTGGATAATAFLVGAVSATYDRWRLAPSRPWRDELAPVVVSAALWLVVVVHDLRTGVSAQELIYAPSMALGYCGGDTVFLFLRRRLGRKS